MSPIRIVVFGAGGRAGRRVVAEALARGHEVTAVVRDPTRHASLGAVAGDVRDSSGVVAGDGGDSPGVVAGDGGDSFGVVAGDVRDSPGVVAGDVRDSPGVVAGDGGDSFGVAAGGARDSFRVVAGDVTDPDSVAAVAAHHDAAVNAAAVLGVPDFYPAATKALLEGLPRAGVTRLVAIGIGSMLESAPGEPLYAAPGFPTDAREFTLGHVAELDALRSAGDAVDWLVLAPPPTMLDATAGRTGRYRVGGTAVLPAEEGAPLFAYADLAVAVVDEIETPRHHRELVAVGR